MDQPGMTITEAVQNAIAARMRALKELAAIDEELARFGVELTEHPEGAAWRLKNLAGQGLLEGAGTGAAGTVTMTGAA